MESVATTVLETDTEMDQMEKMIAPTAPPCARVMRISATALDLMMAENGRLQIHELGYWTLHPDGRPQAVRFLKLSTTTKDDSHLRQLRRCCCRRLPRETLLIRRRRHNMWRGLVLVTSRLRRLQLEKASSLSM